MIEGKDKLENFCVRVPDKILKELRLLESRIEAGQSAYQALSQMTCALEGPETFLKSWRKLSSHILEGRLLGARSIAQFCDVFEKSNEIVDLIQQKTLAARMQSYICSGLLILILISSLFIFPPELRPSPVWICLSSVLALACLSALYLMQRHFLKKLDYFSWILFLRLLGLSLECGNTLTVALASHPPPSKLKYSKSLLWLKARDDWNLIERQYQEGLPLLKLIGQMARISEHEFLRLLKQWSEQLSYQMMIPLFLFATPALYVLLLGPILTLVFKD